MADGNINPQGAEKKAPWDGFKPTGAAADAMHTKDELNKKLLHLQAMLTMTFGEARASFDDMSEELRDNYLWACYDNVGQCIALNTTTPKVVSHV